MDDQTKEFADRGADGDGPCTRPFSLSALEEGKKDKLGHEVEEILWVGQNYAIYRSEKGVYVQFSDCREEEAVQRRRFTEISPELCELRYLTHEMRSGWNFSFESRSSRHPSSLYDHNMAQALMLVMEAKVDEGKRIAQQALKMAVDRVTNDNTIRYFGCCLTVWILSIAAGAFLCGAVAPDSLIFVVAAMAGATGAVLSVATRLQAFQLKPCHQSDMNYLMSLTRVGIGIVAGPILLLLGSTILKGPIEAIVPMMVEWRGAAILGLIAGFAERLIPNLLRRTVDQIGPPAGTPVQAVRGDEMKGSAVRPNPAG